MSPNIVKRIFFWSGVYGVAALVPSYFLENRIGHDLPPPITHPEYYYGFVGVALAFQIVFFIVAGDPVRFRPLIIPSIFEKFSFAIAAAALFFQGRVYSQTFALGMVDLFLGILFIFCYLKGET